MKGLFIMIEGTDGSGKSLQTGLLKERLVKEGHAVEDISFPQYGSPSATMVEEYLNGRLGTAEEIGPYRASVFFAIDRYAASNKIKTWLSEGKIVIANRYVGSNMGHQGGKIKDEAERKKFFDWDYELEYTIFQIPKPDVNIVLHVTPEISQMLVDKKEARVYLQGKKRDIHEDDLEHLKNAEIAYLQIARDYPEFTLIECVENGELQTPEIIHEKIYTPIHNRLIS